MFFDNVVSERVKPYSYTRNCPFTALISGVLSERPATTNAKWALILIFNLRNDLIHFYYTNNYLIISKLMAEFDKLLHDFQIPPGALTPEELRLLQQGGIKIDDDDE